MYDSLCNLQKNIQKKTMETRIIKKTISIKVKEDVGMPKPKKHANKVGKLT